MGASYLSSHWHLTYAMGTYYVIMTISDSTKMLLNEIIVLQILARPSKYTIQLHATV